MEEKSAWSLGPEQAQKLQGCLRRSAQASHLSGGYRRSEGSPGSQGWSVWDSSTLWKPALQKSSSNFTHSLEPLGP